MTDVLCKIKNCVNRDVHNSECNLKLIIIGLDEANGGMLCNNFKPWESDNK